MKQYQEKASEKVFAPSPCAHAESTGSTRRAELNKSLPAWIQYKAYKHCGKYEYKKWNTTVARESKIDVHIYSI